MSAERTLTDVTSRMRPVTLEDVLATAELQTRVDRKYVVPLDMFAAVLDRMGDQLSVLQIGDLRAVPLRVGLLRHTRARARTASTRTVAVDG